MECNVTFRHRTDTKPCSGRPRLWSATPYTVAVMDGIERVYDDDGLDRPSVTPAPPPSDDQLIRLAAVGGIAAAIVGLFGLRWLRRNIVISLRRS